MHHNRGKIGRERDVIEGESAEHPAAKQFRYGLRLKCRKPRSVRVGPAPAEAALTALDD
jgi:hypothetical protein